MRGITRAIVAVLLVVGAVPAVGAAQHVDHTDPGSAEYRFAADVTASGPDDDANASRADTGGADTPAPAAGPGDWWERVKCLRPLPMDPAPPLEPIPCEDDAELVLLRANGDGGVIEGFPVQGGVIRVYRLDDASGGDRAADGNDLVVRKKPGRTTYSDITLERGHVPRAGNGTWFVGSLEHTDSWESARHANGTRLVVRARMDKATPASGQSSGGQDGQDGDRLIIVVEYLDKASPNAGEPNDDAPDDQPRFGNGTDVTVGIVHTDSWATDRRSAGGDGDDRGRTVVVLFGDLDKASPELYLTVAGDDDGPRAVPLVKYLDKATPAAAIDVTGNPAANGLPTGKRAHASADGADDDADADGVSTGEEAVAAPAAPGDLPCPIQWPTGPFNPNGPTTDPCPFDAVTPSDAHDIAGAVTPSDSHDIAGAITPSSARSDLLTDAIRSMDRASPFLYGVR